MELLAIGLVLFVLFKSGLLGGSVALPPGTQPGQVVQLPNGQVVQATVSNNGQLVGTPISPQQAAAIVNQQGAGIGRTVESGVVAGAGLATAASAGTLGFASVAAGLTTVSLIGAVALAVFELCKLIFRGADPNQVPAAKIEQVYEVFSLGLQNLYKDGLISQNMCVSCMQSAISGAQQAELNAPQYARDARPFNNGITNATNVINADIRTTQTLPPVPLKPLSLAAARAAYGSFPSPGWYPGSVQYGFQLLDSAVSNMIQQGVQ